jgi:hypothetical protein
VKAAAAGLALADLSALFAEMYERARGDLPDEDPARAFADRGVRLETTFQGAGVLNGDLTPECAAVVGKVLDALSAPAGAEDDRTREQRYHDALAEAMRRLVAANLLPERTGQPVKVWAHISLADLLRHGEPRPDASQAQASVEQAIIGKTVISLLHSSYALDLR